MESCVLLRRKLVLSGWIMMEENDLDRNVEGDAVEGPIVCVSREEVLQAHVYLIFNSEWAILGGFQ